MADTKKGGQERPTTRRQEQGYDEAARGGPGVPPSDVGIPAAPDETQPRDAFDREAHEAANDVRRQDKSGVP